MEFNTYQISWHLLILMLFILIRIGSAFYNGDKLVTRSFSKNFSVPRDPADMFSSFVLSVMPNDTVNDAFHFTTCKRLDSEFLSCNITMETWPFAHGMFRSYCNDYKVHVPDNNNTFISVNTVHQTSDSKILLDLFLRKNKDNYYKTRYVHLINMLNCSKIMNFTVDLNAGNNDFTTFMEFYEDSIEIVYDNEKNCDGKVSCKLIYDYNGNQIDKTHFFEPKYLKFVQGKFGYCVSRKNANKGYYIVEKNWNSSSYSLSYVDSFGENKRQISNRVFNTFGYFIFTSTYGKYVYCYRNYEDKTLHCVKHDTEKLLLNITLNTPNVVDWLAVRDLSDGGFIVVTGCYAVYDDTPRRNEFRIQRFSADGQMYKALYVDELDLAIKPDYIYQIVISESDNDEFCIFWSVRVNDAYDYKSYEFQEYYSLTKWCVLTKYTIVRD